MPPLDTATHLSIHESSFTEIHGDANYHAPGILNFHVPRPYESELVRLFQASAKDAAYDSGDRHPPSRCHPGTRRDIIGTIERWISSTTEPGVFWLHGPAGSGKSAIAQTICESSAEHNHLLASFFFMRGSPSRGIIKNFIPTLACQVSTSRPDLRQHIGNAIETDFGILHRSISTQLLKLVIEPLRSNASSQSAPFLLVIDGLDECEGENDQIQILSHISGLTTKYHLPVRCLIVSRPEPHIKHFFDVSIGQKSSIGFSIYGHGAQYGDVYTFLRSKFDEISSSERHTSTLAYIRKPWPSDDIVQLLAKKSDGYFIYASTLLKYIDDDFSPCTRRLQEVLQASGPASAAFAELDKLYTQILSTCPDIKLLSRILGCLIVVPKYGLDQSPQTIEHILELWPGEGATTLRGLHAVLNFHRGTTKPFHASLSDFLFDKSRSNKFYIDPQISHVDVVLHILRSITHWEPKEGDADPIFLTFSQWVFNLGFKHISEGNMRPLIQYITREWHTNFWMSFLLKTREWEPLSKGYLLGILQRMIQMFKDMNSHYPDLVGYDSDFLLLAFQMHCPAPTSEDDARCMQNAYTILRATSNLKDNWFTGDLPGPLIFSVSEPIGSPSKQAVDDFQRYILGFVGLGGWKLLDDLMGDQRKCGALYCDVGLRHARVAQQYMTTLAAAKAARPDVAKSGHSHRQLDLGYTVAETFWSYHLLASPPSDATLVPLLRKLTPWSNLDVSFDIHTVHATRIVEWLKKSHGPLMDLVARWESLDEFVDTRRMMPWR